VDVNRKDEDIKELEPYYSIETFKAFVNGVIPRTPFLAEQYGSIYYFGALDYDTNQYVMMMLDYYYYYRYADFIANLMNSYAKQLFIYDNNFSNVTRVIGNAYFASLSLVDQLRVASYLNAIDIYVTPDSKDIQRYPGLLSIIASLNRYTMMGYYSEWYGYGVTRLYEPNQRVFEFKPDSWLQVGYPGKSFTYVNYVRQYESAQELASSNK